MKIVVLFFFLISITFISGCEVCGIKSEPSLSISFTNNYGFTKIRPLGTTKETNNFYSLPINLNAKSTTYIFEKLPKNDTLTVFYDVIVVNKNQSCGYILDLEKPVNGIYATSTFPKVNVDYYTYYSSGPKGYAGIQVQITP